MNNAFVINLDVHPEHFAEVQREFAPFGISCKRFPAIEHSNGALGCTLSHLALIARAKKEGWPWIMIFEEDAVAREAMDQWPELSAFLLQKKEHWDVFFGGCIYFSPIKRQHTLQKKTSSTAVVNIIEGLHPLATHCIIYNKTSYDQLLAWYDFPAPLEKRPSIDNFIHTCNVRLWISSPFLAWQKPHHSDILKRVNDCSAQFTTMEKILGYFVTTNAN